MIRLLVFPVTLRSRLTTRCQSRSFDIQIPLLACNSKTDPSLTVYNAYLQRFSLLNGVTEKSTTDSSLHSWFVHIRVFEQAFFQKQEKCCQFFPHSLGPNRRGIKLSTNWPFPHATLKRKVCCTSKQEGGIFRGHKASHTPSYVIIVFIGTAAYDLSGGITRPPSHPTTELPV